MPPTEPSAPDLAGKKIAVTGARGRLASCVIPFLRAAGAEVTGFSRTGGGGFEPWAALVNGDALGRFDSVLHLAWSTLPATAEQLPAGAPSEDLALLEPLLGAWERSRGPAQLVFFSSGGTIYGPTGGRPAREDTPCRPIGRYGQTKLAAEEMIARHAAAHGRPAAILRISNPYGFDQPAQRAQGIIPHVFHCAETGRPLSLWGDGSARKDFLHSSDFLHAVALVVARRLAGTYNIAQGESHCVRDVIAAIGAITGRPIRVETSPPRAWDVHDVLLDNGKFCAVTGWRPRMDLRAGLELTHRALSRTSSG